MDDGADPFCIVLDVRIQTTAKEVLTKSEEELPDDEGCLRQQILCHWRF